MKQEEKIGLLKRIDPVCKLPGSLLLDLSRCLRVVRIPSGSHVFLEGETGDATYIIARGAVSIVKDDVEIVVRTSGEWIGEFSLMDGGPRSGSAFALMEVVLLKLKREDFHRILLKNNNKLAPGFYKMLTQKLRQDVQSRVDTSMSNSEIIAELKRHRDFLFDVVNRLPIGVFLFNDAGKMLMMNRLAQIILQQENGLSLRADGLHAAEEYATKALGKLIQDACAVSSNPAKALRLSRHSAKRPLSVLVASAQPKSYPSNGGPGMAAVFVSDPEMPAAVNEELLSHLYDLTVTEARVAVDLLRGKTARQVAADLGVTINTVRQHLKRVFAKTGAAGQSDLLSLLLRSPIVFF